MQSTDFRAWICFRRPWGRAGAGLVLALSCLAPPVAGAVAQALGTPPVFADFPAVRVYKGKASPVDLSSHPRARMFRTRLRQTAGERPNFAGEWIVATWGCGTACQMVSLINARTGRVMMLPFAASRGVAHRATSRLLIVDPGTPAATMAARSRYILLERGKLWEVGPLSRN